MYGLRQQYIGQRFLLFIRRHLFWVLLLILIGCSFVSFELGRSAVYRAHPELSGAEEAEAILRKVGALIQLPKDETPTMATINDAAAVKQVQPFLVNAEDGDILVVYASAKTALLYRPSSDQLIAVGPVTVPDGVELPDQPPELPPTVASTTENNATSTETDR